MMDLTQNTVPPSVKTLHLIAVCGTAMGALACLLKDLGYRVTGSDNGVYPPMSTFLEEKGITLFNGYKGANLDYRPDLVVVGNAVGKDNPEAARMRDLGLFYCSMPQAINHFIAREKNPVMITGTHGKTTTSSLAAWVLEIAGLDPSFFIGGILRNFNSNYKLGQGPHLVIEGDEYDTAYFDKGPKFLHYSSAITILTGIEFDHADIYEDIHHVTRSFEQLVSRMEKSSLLIAFDDNEIVDRLVEKAPCRVVRYGEKEKSQWRFKVLAIDPPFTHFEVMHDNKAYGKFKTRLVGDHNLCNLTSVIAASHALEIPASQIQKALDTFEGVKRRQEVRGVKNGITVMDDFAHHPTAVRETLRAVRPFYEGRIIAVFEPRTNTSMRDVFQDVYPACFDEADIICIRKPPLLNKIPEGRRFSSEKLVEDLVRKGKDAHFFSDTDAIVDFVRQSAKPDDLVLVMSNGGFDGIHERLLAEL
jgi:UDP-N-acetylmuramate: L-alanyl-gamma-D-glutamyl-meso-diaminopimelate ligase